MTNNNKKIKNIEIVSFLDGAKIRALDDFPEGEISGELSTMSSIGIDEKGETNVGEFEEQSKNFSLLKKISKAC